MRRDHLQGGSELPDHDRKASPPAAPMLAADVVLAIAVGTAVATARVWRRVSTRLNPLAALLIRPPGMPQRLQPAQWLEVLGRRGAAERAVATDDLARLLDRLVPAILAEVLGRADLTALVTRFVDLDDVVAAVDLDGVVARVDVDGIVARVDVDGIVARVDLDAVSSRLDIDAVAARLDVDAVAARLDVQAIVEKLDLTAIVLERVDLDRLVAAVLATVDTVALAQEVIEGVNLPEIIRESTGAMASDTVHGARLQGIAADEAVGRVMDRLLRRRGAAPRVEGPPDVVPGGPVPGIPGPRTTGHS